MPGPRVGAGAPEGPVRVPVLEAQVEDGWGWSPGPRPHGLLRVPPQGRDGQAAPVVVLSPLKGNKTSSLDSFKAASLPRTSPGSSWAPSAVRRVGQRGPGYLPATNQQPLLPVCSPLRWR